MVKRLTLDDCRDSAKKRGGFCLSNQYVNSSTKLDWMCAAGHKWSAKPQDIRAGYWCPKCAKTAKPSLEEINSLAVSRGGKCLSKSYKNNREKLVWECSEGHQFKMTLKAVKQLGQWCTTCSGKYRHFSHKDLEEIALSRGGKLLSEKPEYLISESADWSCANGHRWTATIANIVSNKSWCSQCVSNRGERICRFIFEELTGQKFPTKRPSWLKESGQRKAMELDGYCEEMQIAFEHQGRQHYEDASSGFFDSGVIARDEKKRQICKEHGIKVLEVPQIGHFSSLEGALKLIHEFLIKNNCKIVKNLTAQDINEKSAKIFDNKLSQIVKIAESKGGECLSEVYLGHITPLRFRCRNNHEWLARPNDIKRGSWCATCIGAGGRRKTIDDLKNMFLDYGIRCMSKSYKGSKEKYVWQCLKGHSFEARYDSLKMSGVKCPICLKDKSGRGN